MYAIIETGGKQYKVQEGDIIKVELLDAAIGDMVKLPVLFVNDSGALLVGNETSNSFAEAEVMFHGKGKKIDIFTYKAKKNVRKRKGHRQPYTEVKITKISK
ncbi:MAG TPA: 50S ribosomal protein L21 [Clostridia bacterium]|jgi:large subunit ribosomal protein L21|nr:50S ribosomal protein L21 [Clostridia bacterium]